MGDIWLHAIGTFHRKLKIKDKQKLGSDADLHAEDDNELGNVVVVMGARRREVGKVNGV